MSEVQQKKYLVMVDDLGMALLGKVIPNLMYVEVQGVPVQGHDAYQLLANPIPPKPVVNHSVEVNNMVEPPVEASVA